jgi:bifunctional UDP-N-acetylglucosamine pyrophosphorylase/glucosamine-1-phosphate N-acetyltransferase
MDAVILAAGLGTRLQPYTHTTPKPLLSVQGRPILDWTIAALPPVSRLIVVVNHLAEQIEGYLQQQEHVANWSTVRQTVPRGTGDALHACEPLVESERLLVLNGDDLYGVDDLAQLASKPAGILARSVEQPEKFGILFPKADGTVEQLVEKPEGLTPPQLANIGAYVFPRAVFDVPLTLSKRNEYEITEAVAKLAQQSPFYIVEASFWYPIGDIETWQKAEHADLSPARRRQ